jgi:hypothetical protein
MDAYSELLGKAIRSMVELKEEKDIDSLFTGGKTTALVNTINGLDDFELIAFIVFYDTRCQSSIESAERRIGSPHGHCGKPQMRRHPVGGLARVCRKYLAAADLAPWRERQPGGKVLCRRPPTQVGSAFSDQAQCQVGADAVNLSQIDTDQLIQDGANVKVDGIWLFRAMPSVRQRGIRGGDMLSQGSQCALDLRITFCNARLVYPVLGRRNFGGSSGADIYRSNRQGFISGIRFGVAWKFTFQ